MALRRKVNIKVRQPLTKILIPILDASMQRHIEAVRSLIMSEVNVKEVELISDTTGIITKRIKLNFKNFCTRYARYSKQMAALIATFSQEDIARIEQSAESRITIDGEELIVTPADFDITSEDMPGWLVTSEGKLTVALDITLTEALVQEGTARELVNRIQNIRKDSGLEVTDKIRVEIEQNDLTSSAVAVVSDYIGSQTLAVEVICTEAPKGDFVVESELNDAPLMIAVSRA